MEVMAAAQQLELKEVLCMEGGHGECSYTNNSQVQSRNLQAVLPVLLETLDKVRLTPRPVELLTVADLGCSCGQNTLVIAETIAQHMAGGHGAPEMFFYFSDLPSNDFNTLFRLLPKATAASEDGSGRRPYFAAGVPGSFHDRLFPDRFINVFTSVFSLHWLSQVPEAVAGQTSAAYNTGKVFVHSGSEATGAAYKRQFQSDLARFLRGRAAELKPGGAMFLVCLGRPAAADPTNQGRVKLLVGTLFEDSWPDLVREGLIEQERMDSFNVPLYAPTLEEFQEAVGADGSFEINRLELVTGSPLVVAGDPDNPTAVGTTVTNNVRSLLGALVDAHVGEAIGHQLFRHLRRRAEARGHGLAGEMQFPHVMCSLSLARSPVDVNLAV